MAARCVLGIHIGHDRGAALVRDGELVAQMAEERLDRRKHSSSPELPARAIEAVLAIAGIHPKDLLAVGISYTNVIIEDIAAQLEAETRDLLGQPSLTVHGFGHHDCHAWSTFCTSDFERALVLVADGAGDIVGDRIEAESLYVGEAGHVKLIARRFQDFGLTRVERRNSFNLAYMSSLDRKKQISIGRKYEQFTYLLGFGHGHAGKTMALAAYAKPLFTPKPPSFEGFDFSLTFEDGLIEIDDAWRRSGEPWHRFIRENSKGIAAAGQALIERLIVGLVRTQSANEYGFALCAAGGLFLSCRLNHHVLTNTEFRRIHVVPAAGDDGQCVGAAFAVYAKEIAELHPSSASLPYLGCQYSGREIEERLEHFDLHAEALEDRQLVQRLATDLVGGRVVGLLRGRSEIGPRALCHRSLLADPRRKDMQEFLNILKGRESFRPFAPVVTADAQSKYFELAQESPYMLLAAAVRAEYRNQLPAVTHVDGSARIQAVSPTKEPFVYDLLKQFERLTGFPILLNTSFNLQGDPIVESPHDAIVAFLSADIDVLVLENHYVARKTHTAPPTYFKR